MILKDEKQDRELLVEYGRKLLACGLVQGTWGNISVRLDDKYMLTTPSGLDYDRVTPGDMVKVEIKTLKYEGDIKPTSERELHGRVYSARPEIGAVIHTHSKYCSIFAAARMPLEVEDPELAADIGNVLKIADYGLPGTSKLAKNTAKALGSATGCIMANHGMLCCGPDIEKAFDICGKIEEAARMYVDSRWER
ncbi:class II aldolase/adducin family protein [Aminicella lysinilytica]|uniref:L-fuculose 1-phosphate aldolase n=1 Tax=Aminicella lysinilytica TaxID=433323 RepID=A0A4R6PYL1_9FIRM|nr:class II aldolase/adducin family protein [Aminicella lysinilytica]TDP49416.1 L-fuculose 1-phosphate aldolase [Aminicella lysinilytica]